MLQQDDAFSALHWSDSVAAHYATKKAELGGETASRGGFSDWLGLGKLRISSRDDSTTQNRELALARLDSYAAEFALLNNIFSCARLLFQTR